MTTTSKMIEMLNVHGWSAFDLGRASAAADMLGDWNLSNILERHVAFEADLDRQAAQTEAAGGRIAASETMFADFMTDDASFPDAETQAKLDALEAKRRDERAYVQSQINALIVKVSA